MRKINLLTFAISFLLSTSTYAQQASLETTRPIIFTKPVSLNWQSIPFQSINYSQIPIDGGASIYTLADDSTAKFSIKIILPKSIFSLSPNDRTSFSALCDLLILGGFGELSFEQIQNMLTANGIDLNTSINPNGEIVISTNALSSDFYLVLNILQNIVLFPKFDKKSFEIWKQENKDNFTNLVDANTLQKQLRIIDNQANILTFGSNHYFAGSIKRISPIEIDKVTNEHVKELYKKIINKNGLNVFLAGNYTQNNLEQLKNLITKIPRLKPDAIKWLPERNLAENKDDLIQTSIIKKTDMTQANVTLRYYFPNFGKLNEIEQTEFSLISEIFSSTGGIVGNDRFSKAMRSNSGISYSPFAYFNNSIVYPNTNLAGFYLIFQTPNERLTEAVELAKTTWQNFISKGITQEELDIARTAMMNRLLATESTTFNKIDEIMIQVLRDKIPNRNSIEFELEKLDQIKDVTKINDILYKLSKTRSSPVLVIMGNPDEKQISSLTDDNQIKLVNTIDFQKFVSSLLQK
jgi:predicted Zn-dependent peptidase